jgi:hypothetical protein
VGGKLIQARFDLVRALNLRGMVAGSLITDYHLVADQMSADQYVREVVNGQRFDNNLSKQLIKGFQVRGLIPNYTVAASSCGYGVEIVWENPDYVPVAPAPLRVPTRQAAISSPVYSSL